MTLNITVTDPLKRRKRHRARKEYGLAPMTGAARWLLELMRVYVLGLTLVATWAAFKGG